MKAYSAGIFFLYTKRISRVFIRNFLLIIKVSTCSCFEILALNFESEMEYGATKKKRKKVTDRMITLLVPFVNNYKHYKKTK